MSTSWRRIERWSCSSPTLHGEELVAVLLGRAQAVDARDRGHHDDVAPGEQGQRGRVAQPVDLVVDRRVLLDVGVARGDVGLGLVVVVVADEVLDPVVGEELAELVGQLGGQGLVGRDHERGPLDLLDGPGDGGALARAGDAEQGLEAVAPRDAVGQPVDGPRLVAGGGEVGDHLELGHGPECTDPLRHSSPPPNSTQLRRTATLAASRMTARRTRRSYASKCDHGCVECVSRRQAGRVGVRRRPPRSG